MIEFRKLQLEDDRPFAEEMFVGWAFEGAPAEVRRAGLNSYKPAWLSSPPAIALLQTFEASLRDDETIAEVIVVDGTKAGLIWATSEREPGGEQFVQLRLLSFHLHFQRQGLGRLSISHIEDVLRERGIETLRSTGRSPSDAVRRFHESVGFQSVQTVFEKRVTQNS